MCSSDLPAGFGAASSGFPSSSPFGNDQNDFKDDGLPPELEPEPEAFPPGAGNVKVSVDQLARAGALISGVVTFSDGKSARWSLDQYGRLGLAPDEKGYRPSPGDIQEFQLTLQSELARLGY